MQLIACQFDIKWEDRDANFEKVEALLANIDVEPGALIALPEMFSSGFSMNVDRIAEGQPSRVEEFLTKISETYKSCVIGGLARKNANGFGKNELSVFSPGGRKIGEYQKNYCFSYTNESEHFESGSDILVFDWQGFRVCPVICYDLRFPELFRRGVAEGANLFLVIANWPKARIHHWTTLLTARAIENQAYIMGVNRVGNDPKFEYPGMSMIIDPHGKTIAQSNDQEECLSACVAIEVASQWRQEFPALGDIKTEN